MNSLEQKEQILKKNLIVYFRFLLLFIVTKMSILDSKQRDSCHWKKQPGNCLCLIALLNQRLKQIQPIHVFGVHQ